MLSATNQPDPLTQSQSPEGAPPEPGTSTSPSPTALADALGGPLVAHCGALTPRLFDETDHTSAGEIDALLHGAGVSDLGWRAKILVTGSDRLRWLNGMVSNTVQALPEGQGNYSFLLSVQGRIQGDLLVYRRAGDLLLDTGMDQLTTVLKHLDHFIIMDDVELTDVHAQWTALSLAGPAAAQVLTTLGVATSGAGQTDNARITPVRVGEVACLLIEAPRVLVPRFELWFAPEHVLAVWETLQAAGAHPCGLAATEAIRVLEATPLYGVDLNDRDLPQETAQTRALNFNKGCYLGQEIVERIRSRGKVNRQFRQFSLEGSTPASIPADLLHGGQVVGRITSTASLPGAGLLGLGFIRVETVERQGDINYDGGTARILTTPATLTRPTVSAT